MTLQEGVSTLTTYAAAGVLGVVAISYWRQSQAKSGEPPLVPYWIPWLGSAITLGKDPDAFFRAAIERFGPIFRVKAAGIEQIYAAHPAIISQVYRDPETFIFTPIRLEMSVDVFDISHEATYSQGMLSSFEVHHKYLSPKEVPRLLQAYAGHIHSELGNEIGRLSQTGKTSLKDLLLPAAYNSACKAFLGQNFPAEKTFRDFQTYDETLPLFFAKAPGFVLRKARTAWTNIQNAIAEHISSPDPGLSTFLVSCDEAYIDGGFSVRDRAASHACDMWALNANAIWAVYWIIALQLQQPEGLAPLIEEIDACRKAYLAAHPSVTSVLENDDVLYDWLSTTGATTPLLASTIQEVLRFCSSALSIRLVTCDTTLGGYALHKGQKIVCMTRAMHTDDEIHEDSTKFIPTRYLDTSKLRTKDGKNVPNHTSPFGGGVSMCEGRHFAQAELRYYVALLLTMSTVELNPASKSRGEMDMTRIGLGILHAKGDFDVIVKPRQT